MEYYQHTRISVIMPDPIPPSILDQKCKEILLKPKHERNESEIQYCSTFLEDKVSFFNSTTAKYGMAVVKSILRCLELVEVPQNTMITKIGEMADKCFILLEGECQAYTPGWVKSEKKNRTRKSELNFRVGKIVQGSLFGEKSIIDNKPRTADVKSMTNCIIGELKKKDFINIFERSKKKEFNDEILFYKSIKIFSDCNKMYLEKLSYCMDSLDYKGGEIIINQDDFIDKIYLIRRGEFEVLLKKDKVFDSVFDLNYFSDMNSALPERFSENRLYEIKGKKKMSELHKIMVLSPGEFFGDIEMVQKRERSLFTLQCKMKGSLIYVCKRERFLFNLGPLYEIFKSTIPSKVQTYRDRFEKLKKYKKNFIDNSAEHKINNFIKERVVVYNKLKYEREKIEKLEKFNKEESIPNLNSTNMNLDNSKRNSHVKSNSISFTNINLNSDHKKVENFVNTHSGLNKLNNIKENSSRVDNINGHKNMNTSSIVNYSLLYSFAKTKDPPLPNLKMKLNKSYLGSNTKKNKDSIGKMNINFDKMKFDDITSMAASIIPQSEKNNSRFISKFNSMSNFSVASNQISMRNEINEFDYNQPKKFGKESNFFSILKREINKFGNSNVKSCNTVPILSMNLDLAFKDESKKSIFTEKVKNNFSSCSEINKNFFLDNQNMNNILQSKYNLIKKQSSVFFANK